VFFGRFLSSAHIITSAINEELRTPSANQAANTIVDSNNNYNNNTMAATYDIVSIGETDASALTRIGYKAFADDLLNLRLYNLQDATPSQIENDLQWRIQHVWTRGSLVQSHQYRNRESSRILRYPGTREGKTQRARHY
jgi:hypothetical protein